VVAGVSAAQTFDTPQYQMWSKWREGASVTTKTTSSAAGGVQSSVTQTQTLKQLTSDKAVVELSVTTEAAGQSFKSPPISMDFPAKVTVPKTEPVAAAPEAQADGPKYKESKGRESLTINGKKIACEWTKLEVEGGMVTTAWISKDVPGEVVKMV